MQYIRTQNSMITGLPTVHLCNARLHAITEAQCIDIVMRELAAGRDGCIVTMNLDHLRRYDQDEEYRTLAESATLAVADGMPLIWASRLQGTPLPERVTGSNLIWSLTKAAADNGRAIFLLGGEPGTAEAAGHILAQKYPHLRVAGSYYPQHGFERDGNEITRITNAIIEARPDIVYVALGSPKQDTLIENLRNHLPAVWWLGVGISFSFVSGDVARAPDWMQRRGLEWLHRLSQEPKRLAGRYLLHGLPFGLKLMFNAVIQRLRTRLQR
jgi:N-acetylglucosaminyldiphosphoundecaprenol N-acetyl-beta-D-mannosaminyltransferase